MTELVSAQQLREKYDEFVQRDIEEFQRCINHINIQAASKDIYDNYFKSCQFYGYLTDKMVNELKNKGYSVKHYQYTTLYDISWE